MTEKESPRVFQFQVLHDTLHTHMSKILTTNPYQLQLGGRNRINGEWRIKGQGKW